MFARKKPEPAKRRNHDLSQFGLTEIPDDFDPAGGFGNDDDNDSDLEAELAAISGGGGGRPKPKPKPKPTLVPDSDLSKMVAESMRDVDSDDDDGDEDDSDLLGELHDITGGGMEVEAEEEKEAGAAQSPTNATSASDVVFLPTTTENTADIIRQRLEMYKLGEANAKAAGESAKARRYGRALKTLADLLKQANAGKTINVDDIPPEISVKGAVKPAPLPPVAAAEDDTPKVPTRSAPAPPTPTSPTPAEQSPPATVSTPDKPESSVMETMRVRQREYKASALQAKRDGDTATALQFLKVVKQFDLVIKMCEEGQTVDLSDMPPPPAEFMAFMASMQAAAGETEAPAEAAAATPEKPAPPPPAPVPETTVETPTNMLDALQQRLDKYKSVEQSAKDEGNASKARRFGRIVKQYEDAIKCYKAGRTVAYDELPVPPGFGPLPTEAAPAAKPAPSAVPETVSTPSITSDEGTADEAASPTGSSTSIGGTRKSPSTHRQALTTRITGNQQKSNIAEEQMKLLLERQKEFKVAAIEAKKAGEIDQAKEYLKIYKGFESLLNAASSGLPVDLSTLPLPPSQRESLESSFAIVTTDECDPDDDISDIGVRVEEQLAKQLMMCKNTRDHHKAMGDVAGMNRFENLAVQVQKDLDLVRYSKRKNFPLPKFHYEKRSFNIVHCNTDLNDSELEIIVERGINYKVTNPKDVDTYVKIEFPLLNDETYKMKTNVVKDTDNPEYEQRFKVEIQRSNRQFQRIFKRHSVKIEVYSRGGFLRSDTLIGTVNVKLQPLETKCDIHDTFDLMEGRRTIGGKLEVKLRVRNPIITKQVEHINEKWLLLDS